jgi:hypothetical protein
MFIPVAWETYYRKLKHADLRRLEAMGLLVITPYSKWLHRSREFKVADWILGEFVAAGDTLIDEYTPEMIDLFTGRLSIRTRKSKINDGNKHPEPPLIRGAMQTFDTNRCSFNLKAVKEHIHNTAAIVESMPETTAKLKASRRLNNDKHCLQAVQRQRPEPNGEGLSVYTPAYEASKTGRVHQSGGALQSCTRDMATGYLSPAEYEEKFERAA